MKPFSFLILLIALILPGLAQAQGRIRVQSAEQQNQMNNNLEEQLKARPPLQEPYVPPVEFLKIEPAISTEERVERLLHGIVVDIKPAYDHYGYEMRRYMAHIAGPEVLGDPKRLQEEIQNVAKAQIILNYWQEELNKEIYEIDKILKTDDPEAYLLATEGYMLTTTFKYNRGVVSAFLIECQSWLNNNEAMLKFLLSKDGLYTYEHPVFTFDEDADKKKFSSLYEAKYKAHSYMKEYAPFAAMVY